MSFIQRIVQAILVGRSEDKLNVPSLPPPQGTVESLTNFARSVKTKLDVLDGSAGSGFDKAVTYRDLYDSGLLTFNGQQVVFGGGQTAPGAPGVLILGSGQQQEAPEQDLTPPPAPTGLMATGAFATILLEWNPPPESYKNFAFTEVFRNSVDNLGTALKIGQTLATVFSDPVGTTNVDRYYWIRFVSKADVAGDFNSVTGTVARVGRVGGVDLADAIVTSQKLASGAIQSFDVFGGNVKPIQQVSTLPNPMGYMGSPVVLLTTDGKLYRLQGGVWTAAVPTVDLTGQIVSGQITDGSVTTTKIGDSAVSTAKIADNSISTIKIGVNAITATRIADNAITTPKIAANAVTANQIAANTITSAQIAANTITADQIAANTITGNKIAAGTISASNIASNTITADRIATGTITAASGVIANAAITNALIANLAVDAAKIADATITTAKIGDAQITNAKISDLSAEKINAGFINSARIQAGSITANQIDSRGLSIRDANNNIILAAGTPLALANVPSQALNSNISIGSNGVLSGAGGGQVTYSGIGGRSMGLIDQITSGNISTYIQSAAITDAFIGNLNAQKLTAGSITTDKIQVGAASARVVIETAFQTLSGRTSGDRVFLLFSTPSISRSSLSRYVAPVLTTFFAEYTLDVAPSFSRYYGVVSAEFFGGLPYPNPFVVNALFELQRNASNNRLHGGINRTSFTPTFIISPTSNSSTPFSVEYTLSIWGFNASNVATPITGFNVSLLNHKMVYAEIENKV